MTGRKEELARLYRIEIRKTSALMKMALAEYGYHFAESVFDVEFAAMFERLKEEPMLPDDVEILGNLAILELWPRLKQAHRDQRENVFGHLKTMYQETISSDAEFAFDVGWAGLVQDAVARIQTYPKAWRAALTGGKEKLGCLVLYIACNYDQPGCRSEVERLREEVRLRSLATCDICGKQGRLRISSIAKTVCDRHAAVLGEMRDDDGTWADPWKWREERPIEHHIDDVVSNARALMAAVTAEMDESNDPQRVTALGRRINVDVQAAVGRGRELLTEYGYYIDAAVRTARLIVDEQRAGWISGDIERWDEYSAALMSEADRKWLRDYVFKLVNERDLSG